MAIVWLRQHAPVVCSSKNPISEWCHRVSCSQFGIHQIVNETLVRYVPVGILEKKKRKKQNIPSVQKNLDFLFELNRM